MIYTLIFWFLGDITDAIVCYIMALETIIMASIANYNTQEKIIQLMFLKINATKMTAWDKNMLFCLMQ